MLKPKRKITRKEIQHDPFLEFINSAQQWIKSRKNLIYQIGFGIVLVVAAVYFVNNNKNTSTKTANALLGKAMLYQDLGDVDNAKLQLQTLVDDYGSSKSGKEGLFHLANISFDEGEFEIAEEQLLNFVEKGDNNIMLSTAYRLLADIALKSDDSALAEEHYLNGVKVSKNTIYYEEMQLKLAHQLIENNKSDKAEEIVDEILDIDDNSFTIQKQAEELKGRLQG